MELRVVVADIFAVFREELDEGAEDRGETEVLHEYVRLFLNLLFSLTEFHSCQSLVAIVDAVLLSVSLSFGASDVLFNLFEEKRDDGAGDFRVEVFSCVGIHFNYILDDVTVVLSVDLAKLEQSGNI